MGPAQYSRTSLVYPSHRRVSRDLELRVVWSDSSGPRKVCMIGSFFSWSVLPCFVLLAWFDMVCFCVCLCLLLLGLFLTNASFVLWTLPDFSFFNCFLKSWTSKTISFPCLCILRYLYEFPFLSTYVLFSRNINYPVYFRVVFLFEI